MPLNIRPIQESDCQKISDAFTAQGWEKPVSLYQSYLEFQAEGVRDILIATLDGEFAGYVTIMWQSNYPPFRAEKMPEIVDFNVLIAMRRHGIGTALMDEAERRIGKVSTHVGIGVGLMSDYGAAQVLYVKRGYVPDSRGIHQDSRWLTYGDQVEIGDSLVLSFTKKLR